MIFESERIETLCYIFPWSGFSIEGGTRRLIAAYFVLKSLFFPLFCSASLLELFPNFSSVSCTTVIQTKPGNLLTVLDSIDEHHFTWVQAFTVKYGNEASYFISDHLLLKNLLRTLLGSISLSYFLYELHSSEQNPKLCRALLICRARYSALKLSYIWTFILYHCVFNFQLKNLTEFVHLVQEGVELAQLLRVNLSFTNHLQNKTKWERNKIYLREMWKNLGPIICGPDPDAQPKKKVIDHMYDYRCRTKACKTRAMRLMLYLLLHNPKIAYSPNGTAADEIIKKVTWLNIRLLLFSLRASSHKLCSWGYS